MRSKYIGLWALPLLATAIAAEEAEPLEEDIEPAVTVSADVLADAPPPRQANASDGVMDELDLERTEITGNQELPKVLYIVPWQKSDPGELLGKPANTLLDEVLAPIDRGEFVRQIRYYDELQKD